MTLAGFQTTHPVGLYFSSSTGQREQVRWTSLQVGIKTVQKEKQRPCKGAKQKEKKKSLLPISRQPFYSLLPISRCPATSWEPGPQCIVVYLEDKFLSHGFASPPLLLPLFLQLLLLTIMLYGMEHPFGHFGFPYTGYVPSQPLAYPQLTDLCQSGLSSTRDNLTFRKQSLSLYKYTERTSDKE